MLQNSLSTSISVKMWLFCKLQRQFKKSWKKDWMAFLIENKLLVTQFYISKVLRKWTYRFYLHPVSLLEFWYMLLLSLPAPITPFADFASSRRDLGHFHGQQRRSNLPPGCKGLKKVQYYLHFHVCYDSFPLSTKYVLRHFATGHKYFLYQFMFKAFSYRLRFD